MDEIGQRLTDVLSQARRGKLFVSSIAARLHADVVAMAATEGFLTSRNTDGTFGRVWFVTGRGLKYLKGEIK